MKEMTYTAYNDPGHGWIEVPLSELSALGIADKISRYSYKTDDNAYLEEDCDAAAWINAYIATHGCEPVIVDNYSDTPSWVRNQSRYTA